jgi:hypothetical protein
MCQPPKLAVHPNRDVVNFDHTRSDTAEISFRNGISLAGKFDTELAQRSQTYVGTARLRYTF